MEKKDYLNLQSKYSHLADYQERYRKELLEFINEAFEKHGNEFVLKPEDCETWEEAVESDEFCACEDLPTWLMIWDRHEFSHEIYPTRIYRVGGGRLTYIDGFDNTEGEFVEGWYANDDNDDLSSIADFINAVLEQEQEETLIVDNSIENFKPVNNDLLHETIADIAFNMGWEHFDDIDSREMARCIIQWAKEFEKTHEKTDWTSEADYLAEIDEYSSTRIAEYLLGKK